MAKNMGNLSGRIPEPVLERMSKNAWNYRQLIRWLSKNHIKIFKSKSAKNMNYVVALVPSNGRQKPDLRYFATQKEMISFVKKQNVCARDYRYSHKMQLMY
jgi:hypothetical protein